MKRILMIAAVLTISAMSASAQNWFVDGSLRFTYDDEKTGNGDKVKTTSVEILPSINYMLNDNWAVGLGLGYLYEKEGDYKENYFGFRPQVTYFLELGSKFYYTPQLGIPIAFGNAKENGNKLGDVTRFGVALTPINFEYRPIPNIGINFACGDFSYMYNEFKPDGGGDKTKVNELNFTINASAIVGFRYYF